MVAPRAGARIETTPCEVFATAVSADTSPPVRGRGLKQSVVNHERCIPQSRPPCGGAD